MGTIYNVFGSLGGYMIALNSRTFVMWGEWLEAALVKAPDDRDARIVALVISDSRRPMAILWMAIYDHRIDRGKEISAEDEPRASG